MTSKGGAPPGAAPSTGERPPEPVALRVALKPLEDELRTSFLDYAMSVIVSRALPDVRDGLKPVHRRILYAMWDMGLASDRPLRKSAFVVGDTMGKYHPHGDVAIYDTLVRMAQDFSLRYPLIQGQGNFGSVDGDNAAAMRYTEVRLSPIAMEILEDLDKETADFRDNYDASRKEPIVLPGKVPNLLVNGSSGIAVGMATNVPPHNLAEVVDATVHLIENPEAGLPDLLKFVKGPDFPTGGIIMGRSGLVEAYSSGRGQITVRGRLNVETKKGDRKWLIVTELPYTVNKANLLVAIADLVKDKRIDGISDLRDESDREGMRVVIELKRDADEALVINQLYAHTALQTTFGALNLGLLNNKPVVLGLKGLLEAFIGHRVEVVTRRTQFDLKKAKERAHVVEGLLTALDHVDEVVKLIRASRAVEDARKGLVTKFELTEIQANAILEMRLSKLASLEVQQVREEHAELLTRIAHDEKILGSKPEVLKIIKDELADTKKRFGDARRTEIMEVEAEKLSLEKLIPDEEVVVTITNSGYIKRLPLTSYRAQRRGGKGLIAMETREDDFLTELHITKNHDYLMFFTNKGVVHWLKVYEVPEGTRYSRGKPVVTLLSGIAEGEKVHTAIPVREFRNDQYVFFATRRGVVKKTVLSAFQHIRVTGIKAIKLDEGDDLVGVELTNGKEEIILATADGQAIRFEEAKARAMGRVSHGVAGIRLDKGDEVVSMAVVHGKQLLTVTENGYGKRSPVEDYRKTNRGGKGVRTIVTGGRNGRVIAVVEVEEGDHLILTTREGKLVRTRASEVSLQGRNTMGVRVMSIGESDKVVALAKALSDTEASEAVAEGPTGGNGAAA